MQRRRAIRHYGRVRWRAPLLAFVIASTASAPGRADATLRVVLLTDDPSPSAWADALRVELASRSGEVVLAAAPMGTTMAERDALARAAARARDAFAAARVEGRTLRLVEVDEPGARTSPVLSNADPRTLALLTTSLLAEGDWGAAARARAELARWPSAFAPTLGLALSDPQDPDGWLRSVRPTLQNLPPDPVVPRSESGLYGHVAIAGFAFADDRGFDPGSLIRGGVGWRFDRYLRLGGFVDLGVVRERWIEYGVEMQPWARACAELGATLPLGGLELLGGAHGCAAVTELRFPTVWRHEELTLAGTAGVFVGVAARVSRGLSFGVRADLDGVGFDTERGPTILPVLSAMIHFE